MDDSDTGPDPQDSAEGFDEEFTGTDPDDPDRADPAPDRPYLVGEELSTEPITDSVLTRSARLDPEGDDDLARTTDDADEALIEADLSEALIADGTEVVADDADRSAEEAAVHLLDERRRRP